VRNSTPSIDVYLVKNIPAKISTRPIRFETTQPWDFFEELLHQQREIEQKQQDV